MRNAESFYTAETNRVSAKAESAKVKSRVKRHCSVCHRPISQARLKVLPDTTTCVKCASVKPYSSLDVPTTVFAQHPDVPQPEENEVESG